MFAIQLGGGVYTQNEHRKGIDEILKDALGQQAPENIVRFEHKGDVVYWIIEAKKDHKYLNIALKQAKDYANSINVISQKARFITGVAGTPDDTFFITTQFFNLKKWDNAVINDYKTTGFLSVNQCRQILDKNIAKIDVFETEPKRFLKKAQEINKILHNNGIPVGDRARFIAGLLLALVENDTLEIHNDPRSLINVINGYIKTALENRDKGNFTKTLQLNLPATPKNHTRYKQAIIKALQLLREMNIRSAINSDNDALGEFYEAFLKYANGAKEMGIVLTPRHITDLACQVLDIRHDDYIFDPTCGTGGFLVSAMDYIRQEFKDIDPSKYQLFKQDRIFGVENDDAIYGLAVVNMIFRGDGKSNIHDGSCFSYSFYKQDGVIGIDPKYDNKNRFFTKILMNPPFKQEDSEAKFVDYGISQAKPGALLLAVIPAVVIKGHENVEYRKRLLERHTLKAVVKLDKSLFSPIAQEQTYIIIIKPHTPHHIKEEVFMGVLFDENHHHRKSKLISEHTLKDNLAVIKQNLKSFLTDYNAENIPRQIKITSITKIQESNYDFSPEIYIDNKPPKNLIDFTDLFEEYKKTKNVVAKKLKPKLKPAQGLTRFKLKQLVKQEKASPSVILKNYKVGQIPVVSATADNNGIKEYKDIPEELCLSNHISISKVHNTKPCKAFYHPYKFSATSSVILVRFIPEVMDDELLIMYLCQSIYDSNSWRYNYSRNVALEELEVYLPQKNGKPDWPQISSWCKQLIG